MRASNAMGWWIVGVLALFLGGACGGATAAGTDQSGLGKGGDGGACVCGPTSQDFSQQALACLCGAADAPAPCTATLSSFDPSTWCDTTPMVPILRTTGCGHVTYIQAFGYGASEVTFDATTGAVVGERQLGDVGFGACNVHDYRWGTTEEGCTENVTCTICGSTVYASQCS
jgi:hypothetical protein